MKKVMDGKLKFNNIRNYYSDFVFYFLKRLNNQLVTSMTVLDVGCGHGRNLNLLHSFGFENLTGIDIVKRTENDYYEYIEMDIASSEKIQNKYDIVLCNFLLMFISNDKQIYVIDKLLHATNKYLLIETRKNDTSEYEYTCYIENFYYYIKATKKDYKILYYSKSKERMLIKRC